MNKHIEITVYAEPFEIEHVSWLLTDKLGCSGTATENSEVRGYLPVGQLSDLSALEGYKTEIKEIRDEDWAENWKKYWHPQKIGERTVICPSWEEYAPQTNEVVITLDPGCAFGTGTHPTTRLCVQALERIVPTFRGSRVKIADVGTGSGILSIAGVKLGVNEATGVDNDESVIPIAVENAKKNAVSENCRFFEGSAADINGKYEIVVSNILAEVLADIMSDLKNLLAADGTMVLSGIINEKIPLVEQALQVNGLKTTKILTEGDWAAMLIFQA